MAYFLCTVRLSNFSRDMLGRRQDYVMFDRRADGLTVCHLGPPDRVEQLVLTPYEIQQILKGWPPFYREKFQTLEKYGFVHLMLQVSDIRRLAWIVATGLGRIRSIDVYVNNEMRSTYRGFRSSSMHIAIERFRYFFGSRM